MKLACFFGGHDWDFPKISGREVGDVCYVPVTCKRCGTIQMKLCWVDKADDE